MKTIADLIRDGGAHGEVWTDLGPRLTCIVTIIVGLLLELWAVTHTHFHHLDWAPLLVGLGLVLVSSFVALTWGSRRD